MSIAETLPDRNAPAALWRAMGVFINTLHGLFGGPEEIAAQDTLTTKAHRLCAAWIRAGEALLRRLLLIEASLIPPPLEGEGAGGGVRNVANNNDASSSSQAETSRATISPPPPPLPPLGGGESVERQRRLYSFQPDQPDDWRVSFRCLLSNGARERTGARKRYVTEKEFVEWHYTFFGPERVSSPACGGSVERAARDEGGSVAPSVAFGDTSPASGGGKAPKRFHSAWPLAERLEAMIRVFNDPAPFAARLAARLRAFPKRAYDMLRARFRTKPRTCSANAAERDLVGREIFSEADDLARLAAEWFDSS